MGWGRGRAGCRRLPWGVGVGLGTGILTTFDIAVALKSRYHPDLRSPSLSCRESHRRKGAPHIAGRRRAAARDAQPGREVQVLVGSLTIPELAHKENYLEPAPVLGIRARGPLYSLECAGSRL